MKVEKRSDRDVGNRKPETSLAANIEIRTSPTVIGRMAAVDANDAELSAPLQQ